MAAAVAAVMELMSVMELVEPVVVQAMLTVEEGNLARLVSRIVNSTVSAVLTKLAFVCSSHIDVDLFIIIATVPVVIAVAFSA